MLRFADKLTRAAYEVREEDIQALRAAGWADADILDITMIAAYFNMIDRVADGLGVEVDKAFEASGEDPLDG